MNTIQPEPAAVGTQRPLVVFADDWGRHPSSCQHLVGQLLGCHEVSWVNTIGMRPPAVDVLTLRRGFEKMGQWTQRRQQPETSQPAPTVLNPLMWPRFGSAWERRLNRAVLARFLERRVGRLANSVILTTIPIVSDLLQTIRVHRWVYYRVDEFASWPGLDGQVLRQMEPALITRADRLLAASDELAAPFRAQGRESTILPHGVDVEFWSRTALPDPMLDDFEKPLFLFWGLIDRRLDLAMLTALGERIGRGSIVLVGPQQNPHPHLNNVSRLHTIEPVDYERLPALAAGADVLIMPYANLPVTRAMQPLKLREYLATGKPVVSRKLPATTDWSDALDAVDHADQFAQVAEERAITGLPHAQRIARQRLPSEDWKARARTLHELLFAD